MRIFFIRHGETTGDVEDRYGGDYDDHLTKKGVKQSEKLAKKLKDMKIQVVYHSPRIRATETAQILATSINVELVVANDLRERNNYGVLTGMIKVEAKQKYPEEVRKLESSLHHGVKGSEDYGSFKDRVVEAFMEIINKGGVVAVVSHGGPLSCIVREVLNLGEMKRIGDCGFLEIEKQDQKLVLVSLDNAELE